MAFNQKLARLAQDIIDALTLEGLAVATSYDVNSDIVLTVTDTGPTASNAIVRLLKATQLGNNQTNPVTGLVGEVFTPHVLQVGFASAAAATDTVTLTAALATKTVTINGSVFTAVAGAAADATQFTVAGTDAQDAAALAAAINTSVDPLIVGIVTASVTNNVVTITAVAPGTAGNSITVASNDASMVVATAKLADGSPGTSDLTKFKVLAEVFRKGTQADVYEKAHPFVLADFTAANLVFSYRNTQWGNLSHI